MCRPTPAQDLDKKYLKGISHTQKPITLGKYKFNLFHSVIIRHIYSTDILISIVL